jgi:DNA-binding CsgD family transcriptional regulator
MAGDFRLDELRLAALGRREVIPSGIALLLMIAAMAMLHFAFTPAGDPQLFMIWLALASVVVIATIILITAYTLRAPGDREAVRLWQPIAYQMRNAINLVTIASPWVLLPGAHPMLTAFVMMVYLLFLAVEVMATVYPSGQLWLALFGLPLSLAGFLLVTGAPFAWPLTWLFAAASAALFAMSRAVRRTSAQRLEVLVTPAPFDTEAVAASADLPARLTRRQREVLGHLCEGRSNKEIARAMGVAPATVKTHVEAIVVALGAANRTEAAVKALTLGIV